MDSSGRLKDGTRWRAFMRFLRLDDLMTSYTNARPGASLLVAPQAALVPVDKPILAAWSGTRTEPLSPLTVVVNWLDSVKG
jgi:hypothetical protein